MPRQDHGSYGPNYEVHTPSMISGQAQSPPHTGMENPMAVAPHVGRAHDGNATKPPSVPTVLALLAVVLAALAMIWPTYRIVQRLGSGEEMVASYFMHGAMSLGGGSESSLQMRPIGLVIYILLMLAAVGGALAAWLGRSLRADVLGLLGTSLFAGAMIISAIPLLVLGTGDGDRVSFEHAAGTWLGIASAIIGLLAAILMFAQLGRSGPPPVHD